MTDKELRGGVSRNPHLFDDIVLDHVERYDASQVDCYAFRRGTDVRGGHSLALGNMVNGFPFEFHGVTFANSELAYICGCFSENTELHRDLQGQLVKSSNGLLAKRAIRRPHTADTRADWEGYNIQWMLYVVWQKVIGNKDFQEVLLDIPQEAVIIEDSTFQAGRTAENWGTRNKALKDSIKRYKAELRAQGLGETAIKRELDAHRLGEWSRQGIFEGKNIMGKILMMCARALREGVEPPIDYKALNDAHIYFLGNLLTFKNMKKNNTPNPFAYLVLGREEEYDPKTEYVFPFKVIGDTVDGIDCRYSNMAGGFLFEFEGHLYKNSEELYLCGEFSEQGDRCLEIQQDILSAASGYEAKRFKKAKYKAEVRADFKEFRLQWMLFVVWQKCKGSAEFRKHLFEAPDGAILVENTTTDNQGSAEVWGCKNPELVKARKAEAERIRRWAAVGLSKKELEYRVLLENNKIRNIGAWRGQNNMGKILMICRRSLVLGIEPPIDYSLLSQYNIYILGKRIDFTKYAPNPDEEGRICFDGTSYNGNDYRLLQIINILSKKVREDKEFREQLQGCNRLAHLGISDEGNVTELSRWAIHRGLYASADDYIQVHDFWLITKRYADRHFRKGSKEDNILQLIRDIAAVSKRMNDLLPMAVVSGKVDDWMKENAKHQGLISQLNTAADDYLAERAHAESSDWFRAYADNRRCKETMKSLDTAYLQKQISTDEWHCRRQSVQREWDETRLFVFSKIAEKLSKQK